MAGLLLADDFPIIRSTLARIVAREKTELYPIWRPAMARKRWNWLVASCRISS